MEVEQVLNGLMWKHANEPEFLQAVKEVLISIQDVYNQHPEFEKAKIIERLREMAKYLPDGRLSAMSLRYYIKEGDRELEISASGLLASQSTSQLVYDFDKKVSKVIDTAKKCGPPPYPRERGWHLDKKERAKKRRGCCGASK